MSHGPSTVWKDDSSTRYKTRLGVIMFLVYAVIYGGFIVINVAFPQWMRADVGSLDVAIIYGFAGCHSGFHLQPFMHFGRTQSRT
jgi:nitrate/nitrite transporter NarK